MIGPTYLNLTAEKVATENRKDYNELLSLEEEEEPADPKTIRLFYKLLDDALEQLDNNATLPVIYLDGKQLSGKTTLGVIAADYVNSKTGKPLMDLDDSDNLQYAMGGHQFLEKLPKAAAAGFRIVIYDEGGDYSRKGAMTTFNKTLDRAIDVMRVYKCIIIFICHYFPKQVPSEMIDKGLVTCLVHCISRNPKDTFTRTKVFGYSQCSWMINHWIKVVKVPDHIYKLTPNFTFTFNNIEASRSEKLALLGKKKKKELWENTEIALGGLKSVKDISAFCAKSEIWVRKKLSEIHAKPEKVYKKKNYYSQRIVDTLMKLS